MARCRSAMQVAGGLGLVADRQHLQARVAPTGQGPVDAVAHARAMRVQGHWPDRTYDEFIVAATLPQQPGALYWKVAQVCEKGRIDWSEVPAAGQSLRELKAPAALLEVVPAGHAGHAH